MSSDLLILVAIGVFIVFSSLVTVQQGTVAITTIFGKYNRTLYPGLNFKIPILELIFRRISVQNRSIELGFQAVTVDQANVHFTSLLLFSVMNNEEETVKK